MNLTIKISEYFIYSPHSSYWSRRSSSPSHAFQFWIPRSGAENIRRIVVIIVTTAAERTNQSHWPNVILRALGRAPPQSLFLAVANASALPRIASRDVIGPASTGGLSYAIVLSCWTGSLTHINVTNAWPRLLRSRTRKADEEGTDRKEREMCILLLAFSRAWCGTSDHKFMNAGRCCFGRIQVWLTMKTINWGFRVGLILKNVILVKYGRFSCASHAIGRSVSRQRFNIITLSHYMCVADTFCCILHLNKRSQFAKIYRYVKNSSQISRVYTWNWKARGHDSLRLLSITKLVFIN